MRESEISWKKIGRNKSDSFGSKFKDKSIWKYNLFEFFDDKKNKSLKYDFSFFGKEKSILCKIDFKICISDMLGYKMKLLFSVSMEKFLLALNL